MMQHGPQPTSPSLKTGGGVVVVVSALTQIIRGSTGQALSHTLSLLSRQAGLREQEIYVRLCFLRDGEGFACKSQVGEPVSWMEVPASPC